MFVFIFTSLQRNVVVYFNCYLSSITINQALFVSDSGGHHQVATTFAQSQGQRSTKKVKMRSSMKKFIKQESLKHEHEKGMDPLDPNVSK